MRQSLRDLHVDELVIHDIPRKYSRRILRQAPDMPSEEPVFSEIASPVNAEIRTFFHNKVTSTIGSSASVDIVFDENSESGIEALVSEYFDDDGGRHIEITQEIAQHLYDIQNAQNSSGLLLFLKCLYRNDLVLAILKVEREEGVRLHQQIIEQGLRTFNVEHIRDLMLTKNTKLFKIVLFYMEEGDIKGLICDQQMGREDRNVASFFLSDFLGCKLTEEPQILTKRFYEATLSFINECVESPEQKGEILNHLISELTNRNNSISPVQFARRVLEPNLRDNYIAHLSSNHASNRSFEKDICMIEKRLKRIQYDFVSGICVLGSKEAISDNTSIMKTDSGETVFEIKDELQQVKAR